MDYIDRSSTKAIDISKLDVCFGGFTPMALSDGSASREQVLSAEKRIRLRREALEKAAAVEAARTSDERAWADPNGTIWHYVVLDDAEVRVQKCEPSIAELVVPSKIEEKPVVSLAPDACAYLNDVVSIYLPDSILSVGFSAFRECRKLKTIHFPETLPTFDSNWLRNCVSLERLELPGRLGKIDASVFDVPHLKELRIGAGANEIVPGAFQKSGLEKLEADDANPLLMSDGRALYSFDGSILVALAVPSESYQVRDGCRAIAKKAFGHFPCLREIGLPATVEILGDFSFAKTRISRFDAPKSLKCIGEKAFFNCSELQEVHLNEGLEEVHANAFTDTAIGELRLPASVERLGNPLAANTGLTYVGADATFSIKEGSDHLLLDEAGCLYRKSAEGMVLDRMMNPDIRAYEVLGGTVAIGDDAFFNHASLESVVLPEGLTIVGKRSFKACRRLERVAVPDTVAIIEDEAFLDTALSSMSLPRSLQSLGGNALVTYGAHHGENPTLHELHVEDGNERFYQVDNMLLERKSNGMAKLLLCLGGRSVVRIPHEVNELAPYAFNGIADIEELHLSERISTVGMRGLGLDCLVPHVVVELAEPFEGHSEIALHFPGTDRSRQQQMLALSVPDHVNARIIVEHYDTAIINASSFDALHAERMPLYDQATRLVARLKDPIYLTEVNRDMCERVLRTSIGDICVEAAKHDDRRLMDDLLNLGFVDNDNINEVIDRVGAVQDASMTGYLLEAKRERFGMAAFDFDL